ncbi:MAG: methyl-coenzyme M reductase family protein [Candidatus Methanospirareceae archaeon]
MVGRKHIYINCRAEYSGSLGYGLARGGTASRAHEEDLLAVAMDPSERHIPFPVCDITQRLRLAGIRASTLILKDGAGVPIGIADRIVKSTTFVINDDELEYIKRAKILLFHHGNVAKHIAYKQLYILRKVEKPSIVVCQCPIDYEDLAKEGIDTDVVKPLPEDKRTKGKVIGIVTEVIRGLMCPVEKIEEIVEIIRNAINPDLKNRMEKEEERRKMEEGVEEGAEVVYKNTGKRGKIEEIREIGGFKFALMNDLYYKISQLSLYRG